MPTIDSLKVMIEADASPFTRVLSDSEVRLNHFGEMANRAANVGMVASAAITGLAIKSAVAWETSLANVAKVVDLTEQEFSDLRAGILAMAREIPATADEIAAVAANAAQLGIQKDSLLAFTRVMLDLGETTSLSAEAAAMSLARFANVTQMSQADFDRLGATVVGLGNNLAVQEDEIVEFAQRLAGAGRAAGLTVPQIVALGAALGSVGLNAEAGASAMSIILTEMDKAVDLGGEKLRMIAAVAGMGAAEFQQAFAQDAGGALVAFIEGLARAEGQGVGLNRVLDEMGLDALRVSDTLRRTAGAGDLLRRALNLGTEAWRDNNALTNEAARRYDTTAARLQISLNRVRELGIGMGTTLLPVVQRVTEGLGALTGWLGRVDPAFLAATVIGLGFAAMILKIVVALPALTAGLSAAAGGLGAFGVALGPVGLVGAVAGAAVALGALVVGLGSSGSTAETASKAVDRYTGSLLKLKTISEIGSVISGTEEEIERLRRQDEQRRAQNPGQVIMDNPMIGVLEHELRLLRQREREIFIQQSLNRNLSRTVVDLSTDTQDATGAMANLATAQDFAASETDALTRAFMDQGKAIDTTSAKVSAYMAALQKGGQVNTKVWADAFDSYVHIVERAGNLFSATMPDGTPIGAPDGYGVNLEDLARMLGLNLSELLYTPPPVYESPALNSFQSASFAPSAGSAQQRAPVPTVINAPITVNGGNGDPEYIATVVAERIRRLEERMARNGSLSWR